MPQSGTGTSVEAVDEVFQQKMIDLLKLTGRNEIVVGWYHSHPGLIKSLHSLTFSPAQVSDLGLVESIKIHRPFLFLFYLAFTTPFRASKNCIPEQWLLLLILFKVSKGKL